MDENVRKHFLFEVYSSEEEEITDVDKLQEDFDSESILSSLNTKDPNEKCAIFGLEVGYMFENWDSAERHVENHAKEVGFGIVRRRLEKNKYEEVIRHTFECQSSRKYCAKKRADVEKTRERESVKIGCPWRVNLGLTGGIVRVTSICKEHNHPLENINITSNRRLSPEMLEEIEFFVNIGCGAGPIICALQKCFPDAIIHPKNVYNAICLFRRDQKAMKTDAAETYDRLMKLQREEHGWFVEARLEGDDNHLTGLFWIRPSQIELWQKFHDVVINDNTSQTNKYRMYLSLTIVVDNHAQSWMAATAVVSDETKETYQWILECLLRATNGLAPRVLFTDADAGMVAAIHETLPSTKHNYCIWHLRKNFEKNLKGKLCNKYNDFVKSWNKCRNSFSEKEFQTRWCELLVNYPEARNYLERALGTDVTGWALCFTH
jgi:MULE transposase domain/FAR1 DNA-binding domain